MFQCYQIRIEGLVQGVNFRNFICKRALELGVSGRVMNMSDGSVWVHAEGEQVQLEKLIGWCKNGPPLSRVSKVNIKAANPEGVQGFVVVPTREASL